MEDDLSFDPAESTDEAIIPDESTETESTEETIEETQAESTDEGTKETIDQSEAKDDKAPKGEDPKEKNREGYYQRKLIDKDEYIAKLETQLKEGYVEQGDGEMEQRLRNVEAREYVTQVSTARQTIANDGQRAASEFAIFNPKSPEYDPEVTDRVMATYATGFLTTDQQGEIVGAKVSLYDYLKDQNDLITKVASHGARKGQTAEAKMRATATPAPSNGKSGKDSDPFIEELFAE